MHLFERLPLLHYIYLAHQDRKAGYAAGPISLGMYIWWDHENGPSRR